MIIDISITDGLPAGTLETIKNLYVWSLNPDAQDFSQMVGGIFSELIAKQAPRYPEDTYVGPVKRGRFAVAFHEGRLEISSPILAVDGNDDYDEGA